MGKSLIEGEKKKLGDLRQAALGILVHPCFGLKLKEERKKEQIKKLSA
jgi:hypothetical protein